MLCSPPRCCYQVLDSLRSGTSPALKSIYYKDATGNTMTMKTNTSRKSFTIVLSCIGTIYTPQACDKLNETKTYKEFNLEILQPGVFLADAERKYIMSCI